MRFTITLATLLFPAALGITCARASELILTHARVYSAPDAPPLEDATVTIHNNRVEGVTSTTGQISVHIPAAAIVLDCTGMSITAGLWNSHVHILPTQLLHADQKTGAELTSALQEMLTRWGFTTVFDIASVLSNTNILRARIASGEIPGPRILTTGEPFFPRHGVPSYVAEYLDKNRITIPDDPSTASALERVRREVGAGADGVKIFAGSIEGDSVLLMPLERARAIVHEAHRLKRPVFVHPSNVAGINIALDSGADVLAHVTSDENWPAAVVARMREAHMALIPTLSLFDIEAKKDHASPEVEQKIVERAVAQLRAYHRAGGEILFGTDVGYVYQFDPTEEYVLMQRAGMSFPEILASLTVNPARRFGYGSHSGRIAVGMDADLTVLRGDPRADISAFSRVSYTIRSGKVIFQAPPVPIP